MTTQSPAVSVTAPIGPAIDRVKEVLFRPFDLGKWFTIGFCAWLAYLGEQGFHGGFNYGSSHHDGQDFQRGFEQARDYVMHNLAWIVPVAAGLVLTALALGVLFAWLNSRGKFMFLHCVALNKAEVAIPWNKFAREGNSLFLFRIVLGLMGMAVILPLLGFSGFLIFRMIVHHSWNFPGIMGVAGIGMLTITVGIVFAIIGKFTRDFVVPIMFLRGKRCLESWKEFSHLMTSNLGHFVLYLLFQIVIGMVIGAMVLIVVLMTCCIAGCLLALPFLGTVLFLPVLVFNRAYSLYYLAQYGREYDVFPPAAPPNAPGAVPPMF